MTRRPINPDHEHDTELIDLMRRALAIICVETGATAGAMMLVMADHSLAEIQCRDPDTRGVRHLIARELRSLADHVEDGDLFDTDIDVRIE